MLTDSLAALFRRDLAALRRELEAYPEEAAIWAMVPGLPNSGGVLSRHLCGNLQHYIGAVLGGSGYRRDRDAEFHAAPSSRATLLNEVDTTAAAVQAALAGLRPEQLASTFPEVLADLRFETADLLVHLATHCAFHLGQLDYHRRAATGATTSIAPMGLVALDSAREAVPTK